MGHRARRCRGASPDRAPPQCRVVKITIRGDEGVPVQVDGEAWIQPPGVIKIQHKNRAQMLTRDRVSLTCRDGGGAQRPRGDAAQAGGESPCPPPQAFESTLKSWEDKQKGESYRAAARPRLSSQQSMEYLTEEESSLLQQLSRAAESLIARSGWGPRGPRWPRGTALLHPIPAAGSTRRPRLTKPWSRSWPTPSTPAPWR